MILIGEFVYNLIYSSSVGSTLWVIMPAIIESSLLPYSTLMNWISSSIVLIGFPILRNMVLNDNSMWLFFFFGIYIFIGFCVYNKIII